MATVTSHLVFDDAAPPSVNRVCESERACFFLCPPQPSPWLTMLIYLEKYAAASSSSDAYCSVHIPSLYLVTCLCAYLCACVSEFIEC